MSCTEFVQSCLLDPINASIGTCAGEIAEEALGGVTAAILLSSRANDLEREVTNLKDARTVVSREIEIGKIDSKIPSPQSETWIERVKTLETEARKFNEDKVNLFTRGFSLRYPYFRYELGCRLKELRKDAQKLASEKPDHTAILSPAPPDAVVLQSSLTHDMVGAEEIYSTIRRLFLEDESAPIIGIYGMGGIGKTTLLKRINDDLFLMNPCPYQVVIFVEVSMVVNIYEIQETMGEHLGFAAQRLPENQKGRSKALRKALFEKKFLLLLDNLWSKIDLWELGVPVSHLHIKGSKVAFTTRQKGICNDMEASCSVEVPRLSKESSWQLFCQRAKKKEEDWTQITRPLAEHVVAKCGGHPQALKVLGSATARATNDRETEAILTKIGRSLLNVKDMKKDVLSVLKTSFDMLEDVSHKECLLYCSLFPGNADIPIEWLISCWIGEGFLDNGGDSLSVLLARDNGFEVMSALKTACLLENGRDERNQVKLHDLVREMALWMTSEDYKEEEKIFLVNSGEGLEWAPSAEKWEHASRISLMKNAISELPDIPECRNLRTLLLKSNVHLKEICPGFFRSVACLTFLDLSVTSLSHLPPEIGMLVELRSLDLSFTPIKSLPKEVGSLKKLRRLDLGHTPMLQSIPQEAILPLSSLQILNVYPRCCIWPEEVFVRDFSECVDKEVCVKDLDSLKQLEFLGIGMAGMSEENLHALLRYKRFHKSIGALRLVLLRGSSSFNLSDFLSAVRTLRLLSIAACVDLDHLIIPTNHLTQLEILECYGLHEIKLFFMDGNEVLRKPTERGVFANLRFLWITLCSLVEDMSWAKELPSLELLSLRQCTRMVEVIEIDESFEKDVDHERDSFFPELRQISLKEMWNLRNICMKPLSFPKLRSVWVIDCPQLKKLPFGLDSAKNIRTINGPEEWWKQLEWGHEDIRSKFTPYFASYSKAEDDKISLTDKLEILYFG